MARCSRHPRVETSLACAKCGEPICPRCMVQTPVGARCPSCAKLSRVPTYRVSGIYYLRAIGAGLGLAIVCGLLWGFLQQFLFSFFFNLIIAAAVGYGIGEGISLAVNRKCGTGLVIIGSLALIMAYLISALTIWRYGFNPFAILAVIVGIFVTAARLR